MSKQPTFEDILRVLQQLPAENPQTVEWKPMMLSHLDELNCRSGEYLVECVEKRDRRRAGSPIESGKQI